MVALPSIRYIDSNGVSAIRPAVPRCSGSFACEGHVSLHKSNKINKIKFVNRIGRIYPQFLAKVDNFVDNLLFNVEIYSSYTQE